MSQPADPAFVNSSAMQASSACPEEDPKPSLSVTRTEDSIVPSSSTTNDETAILTHMRLQSKSSKLDAKPLSSPNNPTVHSLDSLEN